MQISDGVDLARGSEVRLDVVRLKLRKRKVRILEMRDEDLEMIIVTKNEWDRLY